MEAYAVIVSLLCSFLTAILPSKSISRADPQKREGSARRRTYSNHEVDTDTLVVEAMQAAKTGNLQKIKTLRRYGIDLSIADYDGRSVLHQAAESNQLDVVHYLISTCKMPHDVPDRWGNDPMSVAKKYGHYEVVKFLQSNDDQKTPELSDEDVSVVEREALGYKLCDAAARGDLPLLTEFYKRGVDLSQNDYDGRTALHLACNEGKNEVTEFLLKILPKECIRTVDRFGNTPLSDALKSNNAQIVSLLRAYRAGPLQEAVVSAASGARDKLTIRQDLLHSIRHVDHVRVGEVLRQAKTMGFAREVLVSTEEQRGQWEKAAGLQHLAQGMHTINSQMEVMDHCNKPIEEVCHTENNTFAIMEAILKVEHRFGDPLASDVMELLIRRRDKNDVLELFLDKTRADPNVTGEGGRQPLYTALEVGNKGAVQLLLDHGANVNEACKQYTYSPLISLIRNYKLGLDIVLHLLQVLLSGGADPDARDVDHGLSPIHHVIQSSRSGDEVVAIIKVLLQWKADVDAEDRAGLTALQYAAGDATHRPNQHLTEGERLSVVHFLVRNGAVIDHCNNDGNTALHLAAKSGHCAIVHFLLLHNADSTKKNVSNYTAADVSQENSSINRVLVSDMARRGNVAFSPSHSSTSLPPTPRSRRRRPKSKKKVPTENTEDCSLDCCKNAVSNYAPVQSIGMKPNITIVKVQRASTAQTKAARSAVLKEAIEFLSERLGKKYVVLLRSLNKDIGILRTGALLDDLRQSFDREGLSEMAYQGLRRWYERLGNAATLCTLRAAMQDSKLFRLKREFEDKFALG